MFSLNKTACETFEEDRMYSSVSQSLSLFCLSPNWSSSDALSLTFSSLTAIKCFTVMQSQGLLGGTLGHRLSGHQWGGNMRVLYTDSTFLVDFSPLLSPSKTPVVTISSNIKLISSQWRSSVHGLQHSYTKTCFHRCTCYVCGPQTMHVLALTSPESACICSSCSSLEWAAPGLFFLLPMLYWWMFFFSLRFTLMIKDACVTAANIMGPLSSKTRCCSCKPNRAELSF